MKHSSQELTHSRHRPSEEADSGINWASQHNSGKFRLTSELKPVEQRTSFWDEVPLFHNTAELDTPNRFVIQKIETDEAGTKTLHGHCQVAFVSGILAENNFQIGQKVSVFPCLCCISNDRTVSISLTKDNILNPDSHKRLHTENEVLGEKYVFYVNDEKNVILIEDDLLTVTSFCSAISCINNPLIKNLVADFSFEYAHQSLIIGILVHQLIQSALVSKITRFDFLTNEAKRLIKDNILQLYACNTTDKDALNEILKNMRNISKFLNSGFQVEKIEHRVHSMLYGLKGSIDCLDVSNVIEIKTGKVMSVEHRSQAILYTLLMIEQKLRKRCVDYNQFLCDVSNSTLDPWIRGKSGNSTPTVDLRNIYTPLLYYVKSGESVPITLHHEEILRLLKIRNDIACSKDITPCNCPESHPCTILNKIRTFSPGHFLRKQLDAIELEASREKTFFRAKKIQQSKETVTFDVTTQFQLAEYVYIYSLNNKFILSGIIESFENERLTVILREDIDLDSHVLLCLDNDQNFLKAMRWSLIYVAYPKYLRNTSNGTGIDSFSLPAQDKGFEDDDDVSFASFEIEGCLSSDSVEKAHSNTVFSTDGSLADFSPSTDNSILDEVVLNESSTEAVVSPRNDNTSQSIPKILFNGTCSTEQSFTQSQHKFQVPEIYRNEFQRLNEEQKSALVAALQCKNYQIIHGMPGTGKSTVIVLLIKILIFYGQKILLICFTHMAVDNILGRLGSIKVYRAKREALSFENSVDLVKYFSDIDLVVGSCYSFNDPIYVNRKFDYCIVDEGSQMHMLLTLIPLSISNRFCIVGDHLQLKPLCKRSTELRVSLFEYLLDEDCTVLTHQYRMGDMIMDMSNRLFYEGKMVGFGGKSTVEFVDSERMDVFQFVKDLKNATVLCYFNAKVRELSQINKDIKITTVDRFQGSEDDNVVVVFDPVEKCDVLESEERLNVALTRARKKLTLIGNRREMEQIEVFRRLFEIIV